MGRRASSFTQADIRRAVRAMKAEGMTPEVIIEDRRARIVHKPEQGSTPPSKQQVAPEREIVL